MLESLRNSVNSWTAKVLLALLVVSFAVWGISDVFTNRAATTVATVGDREVTTQEFAVALSNDLQTLQRQAGRAISIAEVRELGLDQRVLGRLATRTALNAEAEALGLSASPDSIRRAIETAPVFQGPDGTFNRFSYESVLRREGLSPAQYENGVRQDLARDAMLQAVGAGTAAPRALAEALHRYRNEQRVADYILLSKDDAPDPGEPTDEQVAAFHEENADRFSAPDYRAVSWVALTPESMADAIEIGPGEIEENYEARLSQFTTPATRTVDQLLLDTEEEAVETAARIREGETFADIIAEKGFSARDIALGTVERGSLPATLDEAAFAATEPGIVGPVETAFGWTLLNLRGVQEETVTPLEEVRGEIRDDLALLEARNTILDESVAMDDEIAGGATLEQIGTRTAAVHGSVEAVDARGLGADGAPVGTLPDIPGFLAAIFETEEGAEPVLVEADGGGYYALSVDGITPSALRPLDTVREEVVAAWKDARRTEALAELADDIRARLEEGATLAALAAEREEEVVTSAPLRRSETPPPLTAALVERLFAIEPGETLSGDVTGGFLVGTLAEVVRGDEETELAAVDSTAERYSRQFANDVVQTFSRDAVDRHPLLLYPRAIDETMANLGQRY